MERMEQLKKIVGKWSKQIRYAVCVLFAGGHELYRARSENKLYQRCLLCGYETPGWTIDRKELRRVG